MSTHLDEHEAVPRPGRLVARRINAVLPLLAIAGWILTSWPLTHAPGAASWLAAGALAIATLLSYNLDLDFEFGGHVMELSLGSVPMITAAVVLDPRLAVPAVLLGAVFLSRDEDDTMLDHVGNILASVTATAIAASAVHLLPFEPSGRLALPVVIAAVFAFEFAELLDGVSFLEGRSAGSGLKFLREYRTGFGFSVGIPIIGISLVAPFASFTDSGSDPVHALAFIAVLTVYQAVTWGALKVMQSEQVHRRRSAFLKDSFSRYVPASVVDELDETSGKIALGGALCDVSVMFVDVRDFTAWSEQQEPAQAVAELNELMTELTQAVFETCGTLDKFTGDGLMAFWGAPVAQADHASRACHAAFDMLLRLESLNERRRALGRVAFRIGIGIHSGDALIGNVGHVDRLDFTAIGDTVNLAARLEAATKDAGCDALVSAATFAHLEGTDLAAISEHGEIRVKGRAESVVTYVLAASLPAPVDGSAVADLGLQGHGSSEPRAA